MAEKKGIKCTKCNLPKAQSNFGSDNRQSNRNNKALICNECRDKILLDTKNKDDIDKFSTIAKWYDRPFLFDIYKRVENETDIIKRWTTYLSSHIVCNFKELTFEHSVYESILNNDKEKLNQDMVFEYIENKKIEDAKKEVEKKEEENKRLLEGVKLDADKKEKEKKNVKSIELTDEDILILEDKWGDGYPPEEYIAFEKKYDLLKDHYNQFTAMHTEALLNYIRYRVKEEMATAANNVKEAKEWGALAKDAATAAKINPSQLSKADLTDGLSTFSELTQTVEKEVDIIPILPKFKYRPNDALDFNIWCYVNYIRDLQGLPPCEYEDVYNFYDRKKKEYVNQYGDPYGIFSDDTAEKNRENIKKFIKEDGD